MGALGFLFLFIFFLKLIVTCRLCHPCTNIIYSPDIIHHCIADTLNQVAETGKSPEEIKLGQLIPLPKPNKHERSREKFKTCHFVVRF